MIRVLLAALLSLSLMACATTTMTETDYEPVAVAVRAPCPDDDTLADLRAARPVPLREQPQPVDMEQRRTIERQQLGRYEAPGGFADQAMAIVESCNRRQPLDPPP